MASLNSFKKMYSGLTAKGRRFLSIGFSIVIAILLYAFILEPVYKSQLFVRVDIKSKQDMSQETGLNELETKFLPGDKPPVAAAELQKMIKTMATNNSIDIKAEKVLPPEGKGGYIEVPIEIEFETQIAKLKNLISEIEHAQNALFITGLRIRVTNVPDTKDIYVTMNIEGIIKGVLEKQK